MDAPPRSAPASQTCEVTCLSPPHGYPRLLPHVTVLRRGAAELQVGVDIASALVLHDPDERWDRTLRLVDGTRHRAEIEESVSPLGIAPGDVAWLLRTLGDAGLLVEPADRRSASEPAECPTDLGRWRVRLVGLGQIGAAAGALLLRSRVGRLYVVDRDRPDVGVYPRAGLAGSQAEAFRASQPGLASGHVVECNHWSKPESGPVDLTIVASSTQEPDRVVVDGLLRTDQPHLLVRPRAGGVLVGPLVVPGRTSCVRCADLTRTDLDPGWPAVLAQLCRRRCSVPDPLATWAGAMVLSQALAFLRGTGGDTLGSTLEMAAPHFDQSWRIWPPHRGCGCRWSAAAQ